VTKDAAQALDIPEGVDANLSADDNVPVYDPENNPVQWYDGMEPSSENTAPDVSQFGDIGSVIDAEIGSQSADKSGDLSETGATVGARGVAPSTTTSRRHKTKTDPDDSAPLIDPERPVSTGKIKTGPPDVDEWLDFFSRIVLKVGMGSYVDFVFRDVDEDKISSADLAKMKVSKEERNAIATPLAQYATKDPTMRKHGRRVVALTDSIESLMTLGIWMRRVNRIAKKYKPVKANKPVRASATHIREEAIPRERVGEARTNGNGIQGAGRGFVSGEFGPIVNPGSS
jgi:hypothetical protein